MTSSLKAHHPDSVPDPTQLDLPRWMRRAQRGVDWGVIITLIVCLMACWPFLFRPHLSDLNGQTIAAAQAADYAYSIGEGRLYPRWSPHSVYGFGSPFPNFAPPLAPYASAIIQLTVTNDPITAVRVLFVLSFLCAGTSVYALVQRRSGSPQATVAAALYVLSPMIFITAPHIVGDLAWSIAFALAPALLWSIDRLSISAAPLDFALTPLIVAGLILTHPGIALAAYLLGVIYALWLHTIERLAVTTPLVMISAIALGVLISAFFWLPALGEQQGIAWINAPAPIPVDIASIFAASSALDPAAANPRPQFTPGTALWLSSLIAVLAIVLHRPPRWTIDMLWLALSAGILVVWVVSDQPPAWLPGLMSLTMALASPRVFAWMSASTASRQRVGFAGVLTLTIAFALPTSLIPAPGRWIEPGGTLPVGRILHQDGGLGDRIASTDQAVPLTLPEPVQPDTRLINAYPDRIGTVFTLNRATDALITPLVWTGHYRRYQIQVRDNVQLQLPLAYYHGWYAELNGVSTALDRDPETGLVVIDLPAMSFGELSIYFGPTPLRSAAWLITWISLSIGLVIVYRRLRHRTDRDEPLVRRQPWQLTRLMALTSSLGLLFVLIAGVLLNLTPRPESGLDGFSLFPATTESGIEFLGYSAPASASVTPGAELAIDLAWGSNGSLQQDYVAHAFLLNLSDGSRWAFTLPEAPGSIPTRLWPPGQYIMDRRTLTLPDDLRQGDYAVGLEVFVCQPTCDPVQRLEFFQQGASLGRTLVIPRTFRHTGG